MTANLEPSQDKAASIAVGARLEWYASRRPFFGALRSPLAPSLCYLRGGAKNDVDNYLVSRAIQHQELTSLGG